MLSGLIILQVLGCGRQDADDDGCSVSDGDCDDTNDDGLTDVLISSYGADTVYAFFGGGL